MNFDDIKNVPEQLRQLGIDFAAMCDEVADKFQEGVDKLPENLMDLVMANVPRRPMMPAAAGARRGVAHPTEMDKSVLAWMIANPGDQRVGDIRDAVRGNFPNVDSLQVAKSLKYLCSAGKVSTNGKRGRGTAYAIVEGATSDLAEAESSDSGPTARSAILAVLNELEPGDKISPKDAYARAMELWPDKFTVSSFGGIFSSLAKEEGENGEPFVQFSGNNKNRVYFRGTQKYTDAAPYPENYTPRVFTQSEDDSSAATG